MTKVGIYESDFYGAKGYTARCLDAKCGWASRCFNAEKSAVAVAKKHVHASRARKNDHQPVERD
jgi:hypothetical protein